MNREKRKVEEERYDYRSKVVERMREERFRVRTEGWIFIGIGYFFF